MILISQKKYNKVRKINNDKEDEIITIKELLDNDEYSDNKEIYSIDNFGIFSLIDVSTIDTYGNSVNYSALKDRISI